MLNNTDNLKARYHAVLITLADLRQDQKAQSLGLATDCSIEETARMIAKFSQKAADLRSALYQ